MENVVIAVRKVIVGVTRACEIAGWVILMGWVGFLTFGVVSRYAFNAPVISQADVISATMVIFCSICLAPVLLREAHIRVDLFVDMLPRRAKLMTRILAHLVAIGFATLMLIASQHLLSDTVAMGSRYEISGIPLAPVQAFIPFGFFTFGAVAVLMLVETIGTAVCGSPTEGATRPGPDSKGAQGRADGQSEVSTGGV